MVALNKEDIDPLYYASLSKRIKYAKQLYNSNDQARVFAGTNGLALAYREKCMISRYPKHYRPLAKYWIKFVTHPIYLKYLREVVNYDYYSLAYFYEDYADHLIKTLNFREAIKFLDKALLPNGFSNTKEILFALQKKAECHAKLGDLSQEIDVCVSLMVKCEIDSNHNEGLHYNMYKWGLSKLFYIYLLKSDIAQAKKLLVEKLLLKEWFNDKPEKIKISSLNDILINFPDSIEKIPELFDKVQYFYQRINYENDLIELIKVKEEILALSHEIKPAFRKLFSSYESNQRKRAEELLGLLQQMPEEDRKLFTNINRMNEDINKYLFETVKDQVEEGYKLTLHQKWSFLILEYAKIFFSITVGIVLLGVWIPSLFTDLMTNFWFNLIITLSLFLVYSQFEKIFHDKILFKYRILLMKLLPPVHTALLNRYNSLLSIGKDWQTPFS